MNKIKLLFYTGLFHLIHLMIRVLTLVFLITRFKYWIPKKNNSVLFFENFPIENAGYQYRASKWAEILNQNGFKALVWTTMPSKTKFEEYLQHHSLIFFTISLIKRTVHVICSVRFQTVIVRRELLHYNDYGNLFLEKLLMTIHKNVVLDFDDDIAASKQEPRKVETLYGKLMFENGSKFLDSLKLYNKFIVGSAYLKEYVLKYNSRIEENNICIIPTCVDYDKYKIKKYNNAIPNPIVLGWIGGVGNLKLLQNIIPSLNNVNQHFPIKLLVISGQKIEATANFEIENIKWAYNSQIEEMLKIDIGLMPLVNTNVAKGKCGFKLIQYMGLGIVSVASAITVNKEIVNDNTNGFLVSDQKNDWETTLVKAINQYVNFPQVGKLAKETVINKYSFTANTTKYIEFISD